MSQPESAGAFPGPEARTYLVRAVELAVAVLVIVALVAALFLATQHGRIRSATEPGGESAEFRRGVSAILERYDALSSTAGQLIAEQESDPSKVSDLAWRQRYADAVAEARSLQATAESLSVPAQDRQLATTLADGLRLYATGLDLLLTGFGMGGHGAYYYGSHGNWDLNLGAQRLEEVRRDLPAG